MLLQDANPTPSFGGFGFRLKRMLTTRAVGFLLVAVFLFLLSGATNVGWVRIVDALLWGMLGLSLVLQWLAVTTVGARRRLADFQSSSSLPGPMEDDWVEVELDLDNGRFWRRFFLSASYDAPMEMPGAQSQRFFVASLKGHDTVRLKSRVVCHRRGMHHFGEVTVESQEPFGLFKRRRHMEAPLSLLVYPRASSMRRLALLDGTQGPSERQKRSRSGLEIAGSRYYYPGDPLRHIHWRNTARLGKLAVKELEDTAERALAVAFDTRRTSGEGRETTLEYSIRLAATIGVHVLQSGESVRLLAGSLEGEWADTEPFLRALALLGPSESPDLASLLRATQPNSPLIAIVAAGDHEGHSALVQALPRLVGVTAVVLKGFGQESDETPTADVLSRAGIDTLVCQKGELGSAVRALERLGRTPEPVFQGSDG